MFTIRNLGGVALFLFGTTFLWLTPSFASQGVSTKGVAWSITQVLALVTLALFTAATWGLFTASHAGEPNPGFTVVVHALGSVGVWVLLLVPALERWVDSHVLAGS
jgi:Zn-dependent alcohol dehydrogenase